MRASALWLVILGSTSSFGATRTLSLPPQVNYAVGATVSAGELYVANLREATAAGSLDAVYVLDATSGALKRTFTQGRALQHLDFDGSSLWAVRLYSTYEVLTAGGAASAQVRLPSGTRSIGFAFDRRASVMFELGGFASTEVRLRDRTGALLRTVNTVKSHESWSGLAFDGCSLWTSDIATDELVRLDPSTGAELERRATPDGAQGQVEGLGFDGQALIVTDQRKNKVHFIDISVGTCPPTFVPDAGAPPPPVPDAGTGGGATPVPDAGSPGVDPGGEAPDAGAPPERGPAVEPVAPFSNIDAEQRGCGCGASGAAPQVVLLLVLGWLRRRGRAVCAPSSPPKGRRRRTASGFATRA